MLIDISKLVQNTRGFTLMEVMLVVVLIGVLAALAMPTFNGQVDRAKTGRAVAEIKSIRTLVEIYKLEHGKYPTTTQFETMVKDNGYNNWGESMADPWDRGYYYQINNSGNLDSYVLWSHGPGEGDGEYIYATQITPEPKRDSDRPDVSGMQSSVSKS